MLPHLTPRRIALGCLACTGLSAASILVAPPLGIGVVLLSIGALGLTTVAAVDRSRAVVSRDVFARELEVGISSATDEESIADVAAIALSEIAEGGPAELLLSARDHAGLRRTAVAEGGPADCPVTDMADCVALRHGTTSVFTSSRSLTACPNLRGRSAGPCSAVCAPVGFAGVPLGVLHLTAKDQLPPRCETVERLALAADRIGARVGTLRIISAAAPQAALDPLTGLLDRVGLEDGLRRLMRAGRGFAVALADIDHLADINEALGHDEGDNALVLFAGVLRSTLRAGDTVARFGGEEFALVFPDTEADEAARFLERVQFALGGAIAAGETPRFTVSFGVADTTRSQGAEDAIRDAEAALLTAKESGRNRIVIAHS
jgi:diguanylate cyclase (GGDEF)-like protein